MKTKWMLLAAVIVGPVITACSTNSTAEAEVYVGEKSPAQQQVSFTAIDHQLWDELLHKYVDEQGQVDYRGWKQSAADQQRLDDYLNKLSTANPSVETSREVKLAFWINAYNAVTVYGILREYPTSSIRNHTAKLFGYNIWDDLQLYVGDRVYSLNQMEHEILRKMNEPRIHFAIVCASRGCPRLRNEAYTAKDLDQQLERNAKHFFDQPQNFAVSGDTVQLSAILDWFGEDFGANPSAVLSRIQPWLPSDQARKQVSQADVQVKYHDYDWTLNEQP